MANRKQIQYDSQTSSPFPPTIRGIPQSNDTVINVPQQTQYQKQALVPPAKGTNSWLETVSVDRFNEPAQIPESNWKKAAMYSCAAIMPFLAFVQLNVLTPGNSLQARGYQPDKIDRLPQNQYLYPAMSPIDPNAMTKQEATSEDRWKGEQPVVVWDEKRQQFTYPSTFHDTSVIPVTDIGIDSYDFQKDQPIFDLKRQQFLYPYTTFFLQPSATIGVFTQMGVTISYQRVTQYQTWALVILPPPIPTIDKYAGYHPDQFMDVKRLQYLYPSFFNDANSMTLKETINPDKWLGYHPDYIFDLKRLQFTYPSTDFRTELLAPFEEPIKSESNYPDQFLDLKRLQYTYPYFFIDPTALTKKETVNFDKWKGQYPDIVFDLKRLQYVYPSYSPLVPYSQVGSIICTVNTFPTTTPSSSSVTNPNNVFAQDGAYANFTSVNSTEINGGYGFSIPSNATITGIIVTAWVKYTGSGINHDFNVQLSTNNGSTFGAQRNIPSGSITQSAQQFTLGSSTDLWGMILTPALINSSNFVSEMSLGSLSVTSVDVDSIQISVCYNTSNWTENTSIDRYIGNHPDFIFDLKRQQFAYPNLSYDPFPFPNPLSADTWHPKIETPPKDILRLQYLYPFFAIDTAQLTQHETINPDKWIGSYPDKIFDITREQYLYPNLSFYPFPLPQNIRADSWHPKIEEPPKTIAKLQYLYPSFIIDTFQLTQQERITIDKWLGNKPDYIFDLKRLQYTYPVTAAFDFREIPALEPTGNFSYHPDQFMDVKRLQYLYPSFVIDPFQLTQQERTSIDKFVGYHPDYIFDIKRQQYTYPSEFRTEILEPVSEPINSESYHPDYVFDLKRLQYLYPTMSPLVPPNGANWNATVSIDRFVGYHPDKIYDLTRQQYTYPYLFSDTVIIPTGSIYIDKYNYQVSSPVWDLKRQQYTYPYEFRTEILEPVSEPINSESYHPDYIFDLKRLQYTYPPFTIDTFQLTQHEKITSDKWLPQRPDKIFDLVREQYVYPTNFWNPNVRFEIITADKWAGYHPDKIYDVVRNQYLYPPFIVDTFQLLQKETIRLDKWIGNHPDIIFDLKRQQFTYPAQSPIDTFQLTRHENITLDKYVGYHPDKIYDVTRQQFTFPSDFRTEILTPVSEPINADSYHPDKVYDLTRQQYTYPVTAAFDFREIPTQEPISGFSYHPEKIYDVTRQQYTYPSEFRTDILIPSEEPIKSESNYPDIIFDLKRQQYTYPFFFIDTKQLTQSERSTPDKWLGYHPDFVLDVKRQQFLYPFDFRTEILEPVSEPIKSESNYPDFIFDIRRLQYLYPNLFFYVFPIPINQTADRWTGYHPDFIFDIKREQYFYPFTFPNNRIVYPVHVLVEPKPGGTTNYKTTSTGSTTNKLASLSGFSTDLKAKISGHTTTYKPAPTGSTTSKLSAPLSGHTVDGDNTE